MKVNFIDFHQICRSTSASFPIYCLLTNMTTTNHPKQQKPNDDQPHPTAVTTTTTVSHLPRLPTPSPPPPTTMKIVNIIIIPSILLHIIANVDSSELFMIHRL
jgi:hypothetical protein